MSVGGRGECIGVFVRLLSRGVVLVVVCLGEKSAVWWLRESGDDFLGSDGLGTTSRQGLSGPGVHGSVAARAVRDVAASFTGGGQWCAAGPPWCAAGLQWCGRAGEGGDSSFRLFCGGAIVPNERFLCCGQK